MQISTGVSACHGSMRVAEPSQVRLHSCWTVCLLTQTLPGLSRIGNRSSIRSLCRLPRKAPNGSTLLSVMLDRFYASISRHSINVALQAKCASRMSGADVEIGTPLLTTVSLRLNVFRSLCSWRVLESDWKVSSTSFHHCLACFLLLFSELIYTFWQCLVMCVSCGIPCPSDFVPLAARLCCSALRWCGVLASLRSSFIHSNSGQFHLSRRNCWLSGFDEWWNCFQGRAAEDQIRSTITCHSDRKVGWFIRIIDMPLALLNYLKIFFESNYQSELNSHGPLWFSYRSIFELNWTDSMAFECEEWRWIQPDRLSTNIKQKQILQWGQMKTVQ